MPNIVYKIINITVGPRKEVSCWSAIFDHIYMWGNICDDYVEQQRDRFDCCDHHIIITVTSGYLGMTRNEGNETNKIDIKIDRLYKRLILNYLKPSRVKSLSLRLLATINQLNFQTILKTWLSSLIGSPVLAILANTKFQD